MEFDVIIVGGGPAGSTAAYELSGSGMKVALIERLGPEPYDRYHRICGAGVSSSVLKGLGIKDDEVLNRIDTLRVVWPQGNCIDMRIDGCIIDRPKLFKRLRNEAESKGLTTIKGVVDHVLMIGETVLVLMSDGTSHRSKYVIGADGAYSVVRKTVFGTTPGIMLPVEEFHSETPAEDSVLQFIVSERYGHFYQWYFPYGSGRCSGSIKGFADPEQNAVRGIRTIPMGYVERIQKRNVLLIGDAAGLANPMTAGGLRAAILSACKASEAIIKGCPESYQKWWDSSRMSDRRFMKVHQTLSAFSDEQLSEFSEFMRHKGLWINGIHSVIHHPKWTWLYIGCLMSLRFGW